MKIVVDGKIVEANNHSGSQLWTFANGEVRELIPDYSLANNYKTWKIVQKVPQKGFKIKPLKIIKSNPVLQANNE